MHDLCALGLLLGAYLTFNGYRSFEGDQAYRLPLLLHRQDPTLYASDPFVRAVDAFNPHKGYLSLLDWTSRSIGLPAALFLLFTLSFLATGLGVMRLSRSIWPRAGPRIGWVALTLFLIARAGNVGTNHLFEPMLLDRLLALGLGWLALAEFVSNSRWSGIIACTYLIVSNSIHPAVGLQLVALVVGSWVVCSLLGRWSDVDWRGTLGHGGFVVLAFIPAFLGLNGQSAAIFQGADPREFSLVSSFIQSPQHMIPHLWRLPQWLAWGCYPLLALGAFLGRGRSSRESSAGCVESAQAYSGVHDLASIGDHALCAVRTRLFVVIGVALVGLAFATIAIEAAHDPRVTLFQPFRMATVVRGLCLILAASHLIRLWDRGTWDARLRALSLAVAFSGDWLLVVVALAELMACWGDRVNCRVASAAYAMALLFGGTFLAWHDTESGQVTLVAALGVGLSIAAISLGRPMPSWSAARGLRLASYCWAVPILTLGVSLVIQSEPPAWAAWLIKHARFVERPIDDEERIALWCRDHIPTNTCVVTPPELKEFRLWSRRSVAFNRAGSPYHAKGLADWFKRFRDHVGFTGSAEEFAASYVRNRQALEAVYDQWDSQGLAMLANRQGAGFVVRHVGKPITSSGPLERLHGDGGLEILRVIDEFAIQHPIHLGP